MRVKICGLKQLDHCLAAIDAGADMLGFNFYRPVRRYLEPTLAAEIARTLPRGRAELVGVFVNEDPEAIRAIADLVGLDLVQLSGDEPAAFTGALGLPVVRTVQVDGATTLEEVALRSAGARIIHLDKKRAGSYGGTGERLDVAFAREVGALGAVLLSGGLDPENVGEAIAAARPWGVDVASGVETDGVKDPARIAAFVRAARLAVVA